MWCPIHSRHRENTSSARLHPPVRCTTEKTEIARNATATECTVAITSGNEKHAYAIDNHLVSARVHSQFCVAMSSARLRARADHCAQAKMCIRRRDIALQGGMMRRARNRYIDWICIDCGCECVADRQAMCCGGVLHCASFIVLVDSTTCFSPVELSLFFVTPHPNFVFVDSVDNQNRFCWIGWWIGSWRGKISVDRLVDRQIV